MLDLIHGWTTGCGGQFRGMVVDGTPMYPLPPGSTQGHLVADHVDGVVDLEASQRGQPRYPTRIVSSARFDPKLVLGQQLARSTYGP
jgi:hypothetical protein